MLGATLVVLIATGACRSGGYELYVRNESDRAWLLRTAWSATDNEQQRVVRIQPGAEGVAFQGIDGGFVVEVLDGDCTRAGVFEAEGDQLLVSSVPELVARLRPWQPAQRTVSVGATEECGGTIKF